LRVVFRSGMVKGPAPASLQFHGFFAVPAMLRPEQGLRI
jgi:hypothetical protein